MTSSSSNCISSNRCRSRDRSPPAPHHTPHTTTTTSTTTTTTPHHHNRAPPLPPPRASTTTSSRDPCDANVGPLSDNCGTSAIPVLVLVLVRLLLVMLLVLLFGQFTYTNETRGTRENKLKPLIMSCRNNSNNFIQLIKTFSNISNI